ncbi:hypothetical protein ACJX0J_017931, partial [Zea mays]
MIFFFFYIQKEFAFKKKHMSLYISERYGEGSVELFDRIIYHFPILSYKLYRCQISSLFSLFLLPSGISSFRGPV